MSRKKVLSPSKLTLKALLRASAGKNHPKIIINKTASTDSTVDVSKFASPSKATAPPTVVSFGRDRFLSEDATITTAGTQDSHDHDMMLSRDDQECAREGDENACPTTTIMDIDVALASVPSIDDEDMSFLELPLGGLISLPRENHQSHNTQLLLTPRKQEPSKPSQSFSLKPRLNQDSVETVKPAPPTGGLQIPVSPASSAPSFHEESYRTPRSSPVPFTAGDLSPPPPPSCRHNRRVIEFDDIPQALLLPELASA